MRLCWPSWIGLGRVGVDLGVDHAQGGLTKGGGDVGLCCTCRPAGRGWGGGAAQARPVSRWPLQSGSQFQSNGADMAKARVPLNGSEQVSRVGSNCWKRAIERADEFNDELGLRTHRQNGGPPCRLAVCVRAAAAAGIAGGLATPASTSTSTSSRRAAARCASVCAAIHTAAERAAATTIAAAATAATGCASRASSGSTTVSGRPTRSATASSRTAISAIATVAAVGSCVLRR